MLTLLNKCLALSACVPVNTSKRANDCTDGCCEVRPPIQVSWLPMAKDTINTHAQSSGASNCCSMGVVSYERSLFWWLTLQTNIWQDVQTPSHST